MLKRFRKAFLALAIGAMPMGLNINCDLPGGIFVLDGVEPYDDDYLDITVDVFEDDIAVDGFVEFGVEF